MGIEKPNEEAREHGGEPPDRWGNMDKQAIHAYVIAIALCLLILGWVLQLWRADLTIPFVYWGNDAFFYTMLAKGLVDNGWILHNPFLGMPTGLVLQDFPIPDNLHLFLMKLISLGTSHYAVVLNLYFLLTFPLSAVTALFVFRIFGISSPPAIVGSLLFAFLPYHLARGEVHLFLVAYYLIPLMVMVILWVCLGTPLFNWRQRDRQSVRRWITGKGIASIGICVLVASGGSYYTFFAGIFLLVAGAFAVVRQRALQPLLTVGLLAAILLMTFAINVSPSLIHAHQYGENNVHKRVPEATDIYGLRIAQLLLPISNHRVSPLAEFKDTYNRKTPHVNENDTASLGIVGSVGFLILTGWLVCGRSGHRGATLFSGLATLTIFGLLWATIGGFGSLFAWLVSPQFRGINRVSVYLGFFAIFAVVLSFENLAQRWNKSQTRSTLLYGVLGLILLVGILDQTSRDFVPRFQELEAMYRSDAEFVRRIEAAVPEEAMIFQLPYMPFPESPMVHRLSSYDHFRGYFHSNTLRWSFGAMRKREGDIWQQHVAAKPLPALVEAVASAGFDGIYLNRDGYADRAVALEERLSRLLETTPIVSSDQRLLFFNLDRVRVSLARNQRSAFHQEVRADSGLTDHWMPLPIDGKTAATPAAAVHQGNLHIVVRGVDDHVYHTWATTRGWTAWTNLATITRSAPTVADFMGELWVFVRARDNRIYANRLSEQHWRGWREVPGGPMLSGTAAVSFQDTLYIFARAMDNSLQVNRFDGARWSGWSKVAGELTLSRPAAVNFQDALYVFVHAGDNSLQVTRFDGERWWGWSQVPGGGPTSSKPGAVVFGNALYLFVQGIDERTQLNRFDGERWGAWTDMLGEGLTPSAPGAAATESKLSLVVRSKDNGILVGQLGNDYLSK